MSIDIFEDPATVQGASSIAISTSAHILSDIYRPEHNIAIWQRTLSKELTKNIDLMLAQEPRLALVQSVTPDDAAQWVRSKLEGYVCADALSEDIALIVDMFCCLFDVKEAGLRLTRLDSPMCPKFHFDRVPCRLVTTYTGRATEWLTNDVIDRTKLGAGSLGQPDHLSGLYDSDRSIRQMQPGDVALLKGSGWEGNENGGLIHRSPHVGQDERRLLLTLDFI
ncbi:DUF1826 domain-containing protein [Vibrio tarriae]|uniref:Succinylglutamate desuccinylase n=1 Tax=Vibrio tarriae TaxID=2014742 RepID=A0AAU8WJ77_9VIBR|nr:DUF1826 domain-containing protein [Vibrio tarriae]ASK56004.1 succinylglutamate desuccinylase [Vibrio tarriae]RBM47924.1 DUF1826 domain-containing protein [Vibrio tarriae]